MKLVPTKNNIVIKPIAKEETTESGIILPGVKENSDFAIVDAIGSEVSVCKIGDKVVFNNQGRDIILDGEKYVIVCDKDILAIIE